MSTPKSSKNFFTRALNISEPWVVRETDFSGEECMLDLPIDLLWGSTFYFPEYGKITD